MSTRTVGVAAGLSLVVTVGAMCAPGALAAASHAFRASYTGHGSGSANGTGASGSASLTGRGRLIGAGTLTGSGHGLFVSRTCISFGGNVLLKGTRGSIKLAASHSQACSTKENDVSFSGKARITGGTARFAGAHGTLSFAGTYARQTATVTISLTGRITY